MCQKSSLFFQPQFNSNRPAPPPPPVGKPDSGRPRAPPPSGRPNMPPPPPKPNTHNRPPPPPYGNLGGPPGPSPPPPPGPPPPSGPPPPINNFPPPPSTGGHQPPPPPLKPVKRDNPLGDSKSALNAAINAGGFKLKPVDHSIDHGNIKIFNLKWIKTLRVQSPVSNLLI